MDPVVILLGSSYQVAASNFGPSQTASQWLWTSFDRNYAPLTKMPSRSLLMAILAGAAIHQIRAACADSYNYNFAQVTANQCSSAPYGPYCWRNTCAACGDTQQSPINIAQHYVRTVAKQLPLEFEGNDIHNGCTRACGRCCRPRRSASCARSAWWPRPGA